MSRSNRKRSPGLLRIWITRFGRLVDALLPRSPGWILAACAMVGIGIGGYQAWRFVVPWVGQSNHYLVGPEDIVITQTPPWIRSDIKKKVILDASLDGSISVLDGDLKERIWSAFEFHPWVKEVQRVELCAGPRIEVALLYRRPVAIVQVEDKQAKESDYIPIDIEGRRLPSEDLTQTERKNYPLITSLQGLPLEGETWSDPRIVGAAQLANLLAADWKTLELTKIRPFDSNQLERLMAADWNQLKLTEVWTLESNYDPKASPQKILEKTSYLLGRTHGPPIIWGYAPNLNIPGEPSDSAKVAKLKHLVSEPDDIGGPQAIDLRQVLKSERTARKNSKVGPK